MATQPVPVSSACSAVLAVHVYRESAGWRTRLLPGCLLINRTASMLQLSLSSPALSSSPAAASGQLPLVPQSPQKDPELGAPKKWVTSEMSLRPCADQSSEQRLLTFVGRRQSAGEVQPLSTVRIWLGSGSGWSNPVTLWSLSHQVESLQHLLVLFNYFT